MQFFLLIPLNVKLTIFITFMILLRWRKRLNTTGNWRLVNGTEQTEYKQNNQTRVTRLNHCQGRHKVNPTADFPTVTD